MGNPSHALQAAIFEANITTQLLIIFSHSAIDTSLIMQNFERYFQFSGELVFGYKTPEGTQTQGDKPEV